MPNAERKQAQAQIARFDHSGTSNGASRLGYAGEADAACYAAKARGRGCVVVFSTMDAELKRA